PHHSPHIFPLLHDRPPPSSPSFLFTPPPPTDISTLSLHDALPISRRPRGFQRSLRGRRRLRAGCWPSQSANSRKETAMASNPLRSEEHTSELQSLAYLVCRLLLEKKKKKKAEI